MAVPIAAPANITPAQLSMAGAVLRAGAEIDARVLQILLDGTARLAVSGGGVVDATTDLALQPGMTLRVAVSQIDQGLRLSVLNVERPDEGATARNGVALAPEISESAPSVRQAAVLSPVEARVVAKAAEGAAAKQQGLSPLFADLQLAVSGDRPMPMPVQRAAAQVLARQIVADAPLDERMFAEAVETSGLFLEANLTKGRPVPPAMPDLKAALLVLKQALAAALSQPSPAEGPPPQHPLPTIPGASAIAFAPARQPATLPHSTAAAGGDPADISSPFAPAISVDARPEQNVIAGTRPQLLPAGEPAIDGIDRLLQTLIVPATTVEKPAAPAARTAPPPPLADAWPSAQAAAPATVDPDVPQAVLLRHLLAETDGALARQTLLQIASLPDRADAASGGEALQPRWCFEIPFATPQGTAIAQFAIARDQEDAASDPLPQRRWSARFSLAVEPAGPIHALVTLTGEVASVRLWAERPGTAAALRAQSTELATALTRAAIAPGDIVVREGIPPQPKPAHAARFVDRAS